MPFYKTKILNREISLEYEKKDEKKIIDSINLINEKIDDKLQNPKYSNGKISDTILLSLLSIELQAELSEKLNIERISLETGAGEFFDPARKLFKKCNFLPCDPFAHYKKDRNSIYLTKIIKSD